MLGDKIIITDNGKEIFGIFEDIDDDGFLLLRDRDGVKKIFSGDVTLR